MAGYRGGKPMLARCTYLAEPKTSDKQDLVDMGEAGLIDASAGFDEAGLSGFVQRVNPAGVRS
jgi:hypothetical protein